MSGALACPRCDTALAARRSFWDQAPLEHLFVALLPFLIVALASALLSRYAYGPDRAGQK